MERVILIVVIATVWLLSGIISSVIECRERDGKYRDPMPEQLMLILLIIGPLGLAFSLLIKAIELLTAKVKEIALGTDKESSNGN